MTRMLCAFCPPTIWATSLGLYRHLRRPRSSYQRVVQGKCPLHFLNLNGVVCSNTLFSNTSALTSSLLFWGNSTCNVLEHLVWSNTSGFQFWGPLARTNFLSALCGLPNIAQNLRQTKYTEHASQKIRPSRRLGLYILQNKRPHFLLLWLENFFFDVPFCPLCLGVCGSHGAS